MKTLPRLAVAALLLAVACVPPTKIVSKKADKVEAARKRILVRSNFGNSRAGGNFGPVFAEAFGKRFAELIVPCGAEVKVDNITGFEMDQSADLASSLTAFKPDTVMAIVKTSGTVPYHGATELVRGTFSMDMWDTAGVPDVAKHLKENKNLPAIWRSSVEINRGATLIPLDQRGSAVAEEVTNQMKLDGFFPGCPQYVAPKKAE